MSYDEGLTIEHTLAATDFGTLAPTTATIPVPPGMTRGRILDVGIKDVTEAFDTDTLEGNIAIGYAADDNEYVDFSIPDNLALKASANVRNDTDAIIEADVVVSDLDSAQLLVTYTAGTASGTVAGIGVPFVTVRWY